MNPTSLYVSTCRLVLQGKLDDSSAWLDLYKNFPCLRQALSCTVCGNLLMEPYTPTETSCQHHVCRSCRGGRKKLKPSCSWCKDYSKYVENVQLRTLLQCYKRICQYIMNSDVYRTLCTLPSSSNNNNGTLDNSIALIDIIKEGAGFKDEFVTSTNIRPYNFVNNSNCRSTGTQTLDTVKVENLLDGEDRLRGTSLQNGTCTSYSVTYAEGGNRLTFKRTAKEMEEANHNSDDNAKGGKINKVRKRSVYIKLPSCKCGHVSQGKSTCRGYRCPCYSSDKPCTDCSCKGCNNPRGVRPEKDEDELPISSNVPDSQTQRPNELTAVTSTW